MTCFVAGLDVGVGGFPMFLGGAVCLVVTVFKFAAIVLLLGLSTFGMGNGVGRCLISSHILINLQFCHLFPFNVIMTCILFSLLLHFSMLIMLCYRLSL